MITTPAIAHYYIRGTNDYRYKRKIPSHKDILYIFNYIIWDNEKNKMIILEITYDMKKDNFHVKMPRYTKDSNIKAYEDGEGFEHLE